MNKVTHNGMRMLLEHPKFARYWIGSGVSAFGDQIGWIALIWLVLSVGGGARSVGVVTLLYQLPQTLIAPIAGVWLDRLPKARVMAIANSVMGVVFLSIAIVSARIGHQSLDLIYVLVAILGIVLPFDSIGTSPLIGELVQRDKWSEAYFLNETQVQLATLLGPALGGILVSVIGTVSLLYVDALSFFICGAVLFTIPQTPTTEIATTRQGPLSEFVDGLRCMFRFRSIVALGVVSFFFYFLYGPYEVILPVLSKAKFGGSTALGTLWTVFSVGSVLGGLLFSSKQWKYRLSMSLALIIVLWGIVTFGLAYASSFLWALVMMFIGGVVFSPWGALVALARQKVVPIELQSRVNGALRAITAGGMPLGAITTSLVLHTTGAFVTLIVSGAATVLVGILGYLWPTFRRIDEHVKRPNEQSVRESS